MKETIKLFCASHWFDPADVSEIKEILQSIGCTNLTLKVPFREGVIPVTLIKREDFLLFVESQTENLIKS